MNIQYICKCGIPNKHFEKELISLRKKIFINEKSMCGFQYIDEWDVSSLQIYILNNKQLLGNSRSRYVGKNIWKIERVCVDKKYRSDGIGSEMIFLLEEEVKKRGGRELILSSQQGADSFYEKMGYRKQGSYFKYFGVSHINMEKKLNKEN